MGDAGLTCSFTGCGGAPFCLGNGNGKAVWERGLRVVDLSSTLF